MHELIVEIYLQLIWVNNSDMNGSLYTKLYYWVPFCAPTSNEWHPSTPQSLNYLVLLCSGFSLREYIT